MPLYTYIMSYKEMTKVSQHKHSNYTGFILTPVAAMFPNLKPSYGEIMRMRPEPVLGTERTWACSTLALGEPFVLHVIETRE